MSEIIQRANGEWHFLFEKAKSEIDSLRQQNEILKRAVEEILETNSNNYADMIARKALADCDKVK